MADDPVTVATYRFTAKAEFAKWALEQEGIPAFVSDGNLVTADWFFGNAIGYVKLQVPRSQVPAALDAFERNPELLDSRGADEAEDAPDKCLECGESLPDDSDRCPSCGWSYETCDE